MELNDLLKIAKLIGLSHAKIDGGYVRSKGKIFDPENSPAQLWKVFEWLMANGRFIRVWQTSVKYSFRSKCFLSEEKEIRKGILSIASRINPL
jgi:hypothetical protein